MMANNLERAFQMAGMLMAMGLMILLSGLHSNVISIMLCLGITRISLLRALIALKRRGELQFACLMEKGAGKLMLFFLFF